MGRKGQIAWNKGLTKESDERIMNYTKKRLLKIDEIGKKISKRLKDNWGKCTEEERIKRGLKLQRRVKLFCIRPKCKKEFEVVRHRKNRVYCSHRCQIEDMKRLFKGHKVTEETRDKLKISNKIAWERPEVKDKYFKSREYMYKDLNYLEKRLKGWIRAIHMKPNKCEQKLINFFTKENLPYNFVGDGKFFLAGKCPDFINTNGEKIVIEFAGRYFHTEEEMRERSKLFLKYGFKTIVIWEEELLDLNQIKDKINGGCFM